MKAVLLVAGAGTRFGSKEPKCLTSVHGQTVISRLINQIQHHIPKAEIVVVLGYRAQFLEKYLKDQRVSFVRNDSYTNDKNLKSALLGVKDAENGALIIEGDCVYDDLAFKEIARGMARTSTLFVGAPARQDRTNAVIHVHKGFFDSFFIGERKGLVGKSDFEMTGALWISKKDIDKYLRAGRAMARGAAKRYYFEPLFNKKQFRIRCKRLSGARYTFNTLAEYDAVLRKFSPIRYFPVSDLKPIEGFSNRRATWLREKILKERVWTRPICIDPSGLVMDGHHRTEVSIQLGLAYVPVMVFDYRDIEIHSLRPNHVVSSSLIIDRVKNKMIYPYKTVKHKFPVDIPDCCIDIDLLYGH